MKKLFILPIIFILFISCSPGAEEDSVTSASWEQDGELLPIAVEALEITEGRLVPLVEAAGTIRGIKEAWVISETSGKITGLFASLGQKVKEGEVILTVDNELQRLNRDLALQQFESTRLDYDALEQSYNKGGLSRSDFNSAKSRLLQAQSAFESADRALEATYLKAPFDGVIALLDSDLTVGGNLSPGNPVALVIDRTRMKMEISLGERQVDLIEAGQEALISITSLPDREPVKAMVEAIGAGSDTRTGSFPVLLTWENFNNGAMRSGLSAKVLLENTRERERIVIPSSAIVIRNRRKSVFLAEGDKAVLREITTGESLGGHTVIEEGIETGEYLIVSALTSLSDGFPVETTIAGETGDWR